MQQDHSSCLQELFLVEVWMYPCLSRPQTWHRLGFRGLGAPVRGKNSSLHLQHWKEKLWDGNPGTGNPALPGGEHLWRAGEDQTAEGGTPILASPSLYTGLVHLGLQKGRQTSGSLSNWVFN